ATRLSCSVRRRRSTCRSTSGCTAMASSGSRIWNCCTSRHHPGRLAQRGRRSSAFVFSDTTCGVTTTDCVSTRKGVSYHKSQNSPAIATLSAGAHMRYLSIFLCPILVSSLVAAEKPQLALHVAKAITAAGEPIDNATILVADGKIQAIGPRAKIATPSGYEVIDHGDKWAMPGLIDAHSHVGGTGDINERVYQTN